MRNKVLSLMHEIQYCCVTGRMDYTNSAFKSVGQIAGGIAELLNLAGESGDLRLSNEMSQGIQSMLPPFLEAQEKRDLVRIIDILEAEILPWLQGIASELSTGNIEEDFDFWEENLDALNECGQERLYNYLISNGTYEACANKQDDGASQDRIQCEYAISGDIAFRLENGNTRYLTGRNYPYTDALNFIYEERKDTITKYGFGTGAMIYELLALYRINISTKMILIEDGAEMLMRIMRHFDLADIIRSGRMEICYKDIHSTISECIRQMSLLTKPVSVLFPEDEKVRKAYEKYRRIMISSKEEKYLLYFNYEENRRLQSGYISDIGEKIEGKTVYLVAGGPSLNPCLPLLKNRDKDSAILCVGTSSGKLLKEGIDPDYVIISDPLPEMKRQLDHPFDPKKTSLIFLCTAYSYAVESFGGTRYIVYQKDFEKAEAAADAEEKMTFLTGGSVSTLALDILLRLQAGRIICLGLDLAYTYNQMHAAGIHKVNAAPESGSLVTVKSTNGEMIKAPANLNSYREWIVDRLRDYSGETEIINVSDGAYIEGMKNVTCREYND
ncbi:motility associated factor glycosyltransferase family protein [Butyrivibrio proteoclasticus]|uniref:motility associated factor glycosyltransferase family protein n=1 Tax=Butyrivibrio proteoclasticus TaxID=43305 RepID=UPI0004793C46|nr:6-hydroxymethylpterin diphosphokinase MptE-like protein [Butyrivibrio proteoclasticus]